MQNKQSPAYNHKDYDSYIGIEDFKISNYFNSLISNFRWII